MWEISNNNIPRNTRLEGSEIAGVTSTERPHFLAQHEPWNSQMRMVMTHSILAVAAMLLLGAGLAHCKNARG